MLALWLHLHGTGLSLEGSGGGAHLMLVRFSAMPPFLQMPLLLLLLLLPLAQQHAGLCPSNAQDEQELC